MPSEDKTVNDEEDADEDVSAMLNETTMKAIVTDVAPPDLPHT